MLRRGHSLRPADDVLRDWSDWSNRYRDASDDDSDDATSTTIVTLWPEPGRTLVPPYAVEAHVVSSDDLISHNLRLFAQSRGGFRYDGDHLWASSSPETTAHVKIHDLLVRSPRNRNSGRGTALLLALERLCRMRQISWIGGGISHVDDMHRVEEFYRHRGYAVIKGVPDMPFEWQILKEL